MASEIITVITDDIDGSTDAAEVTFGLDGVNYTIDLTEKNASKLRAVFGPYLAVATKVSSAPRQKVSTGTRRATRVDTRAAREWLAANGYDIKDRGRIPTDALAAYEARIPAKPAGKVKAAK